MGDGFKAGIHFRETPCIWSSPRALEGRFHGRETCGARRHLVASRAFSLVDCISALTQIPPWGIQK